MDTVPLAPDRAQQRGKRKKAAVPVRSLPERVEHFCQLLADIYRTAGEPCH